MNLVTQSLKSLYDNIRQWIVDLIFDHIVANRKRETIRKCIQYNAKCYLVQEGQFKFRILMNKQFRKKNKNFGAMEIARESVFVAYPHIHNLKNYKPNGKKRKHSKAA